MEDHPKNEASENPKNEKRNPEDEIPYWLQGLEETGPLKPSPEGNEDPSAEGWFKEKEPTTSSGEQQPEPVSGDENDTTEEVPTSPKPDQDSGDTPPNWLSELSGVDPTTPDIQGQTKPSPERDSSPKDGTELEPGFSDEDTDKIILDTLPDALEKTEPVSTPDAEFIEISGMDFDHVPMTHLDELDELLPDDEDLPVWLDEMISERSTSRETNGSSGLHSEDTFDEMLAEPTKTVTAPQGEDLEPEETGQTQAAEPEEAPAPDISDEETLPVAVPPEQEPVEVFSPDELPRETEAEGWEPTKNIDAEIPLEGFPKDGTEDDFSPFLPPNEPADAVPEFDSESLKELESEVPVTPLPAFETEPAVPAMHEEAPTEESPVFGEPSEGKSEPTYDQTQPMVVEDTLRFAKYVLDQGDVERALDIINSYIRQSTYLNEIKTWLTEAVGENPQNGSNLWESLGDIAVCQGKHQEALVAYTNAIHILLDKKEDNGSN